MLQMVPLWQMTREHIYTLQNCQNTIGHNSIFSPHASMLGIEHSHSPLDCKSRTHGYSFLFSFLS